MEHGAGDGRGHRTGFHQSAAEEFCNGLHQGACDVTLSRAIARTPHAKSPDEPCGLSGLFNPGDDLVSHTVARAVPSAQRGLTSVFGMGTGVTLSVRLPENLNSKNGSLTTQY